MWVIVLTALFWLALTPQLEACLRRWRFGGRGFHSITIQAGTGGPFLTAWEIAVSQNERSLRLSLPRGR